MSDVFTLRSRRLVAAAFLVCACLFAGRIAVAVEMESLYTVDVPFDGRAADSQQAAYEEALRVVLVRMTGLESARDDADLVGLFPTPSRFVLQFARGEENSLVVTLDGPAIARTLERAGYPVWGRDRPLTLVWLAVEWAPGERELIAAEDAATLTGRNAEQARQLREGILDAAAYRGVPLQFPLVDANDLASISFSDVWGGFDEALLDASRRYGSSSILVGRVRAEDPFRNRWTYYIGNRRLNWTGTGETAVNLLADALAEQFAVSGSANVEDVILTISGVDSIDAYGEVQRMLSSLSVIDDFRIDTVQAGEIRYVVSVPGGRDRLASALEFSGVLSRPDWLGADDFFGGQSSGGSLNYEYRVPGGAPVRDDGRRGGIDPQRDPLADPRADPRARPIPERRPVQ